MQIISFKIDGKKHRYFISGDVKLPSTIDLSDSTVSLNGKTADFYVKDGSLFKFIKSKRHQNKRRLLSENVDKLFGWTPASKEARGNRLLKEIGLPVVSLYGVGFPLSIFSPFRCIYIQKFLDDAVTLQDYLAQDISPVTKKQILDKVFGDILQMHKHQLSYRYMAPKDIMVDRENNIYWIDTRVKHIEEKEEFEKQFTRHLFNLLQQLPESSVSLEQLTDLESYIDKQNDRIQRILIQDD